MNDCEDKQRARVSKLILTRKDFENEKWEDNVQSYTSNTSVHSPILGRYYKLPDYSKSFDHDPPKLDSSLPYIPVYTHLQTFDLASIERPNTPPMINKLRSGGSMQLKHHPSTSKSKAVQNRGASGDQADQAITQSETIEKHENIGDETLTNEST